MKVQVLCAVLTLAVVATAQEAKKVQVTKTLSNGWGDSINWVQTYEEGLKTSMLDRKPLMVIFWLEECPYSTALRATFAQDKDLQQLAQNDFVMLNLQTETTDKNMAPDGYYYPRIMFVDPGRKVRADVTGRYSNHLYAYQAGDEAVLLDSMKRVLKLAKDEL
ncbi:anterior gradient protein 2 homolog [Petromyzon marinus]|uniref:Anterior gradient protein 2 homolog n=1 Tax=Petromyzon marinus TaxID=7757 RepID=A0AAJ7TQ63_PETMA|nr:anterior gradient protein 2 homolog [Petromyzon marinus]